jgi:hypothetical protein
MSPKTKPAPASAATLSPGMLAALALLAECDAEERETGTKVDRWSREALLSDLPEFGGSPSAALLALKRRDFIGDSFAAWRVTPDGRRALDRAYARGEFPKMDMAAVRAAYARGTDLQRFARRINDAHRERDAAGIMISRLATSVPLGTFTALANFIRDLTNGHSARFTTPMGDLAGQFDKLSELAETYRALHSESLGMAERHAADEAAHAARMREQNAERQRLATATVGEG